MLDRIKSYRSFKAGETIVWRGDTLTHVSSVVHGIATLSKTLDDGRMQMVGLLLPSDFIGRPGRKTLDFDVVAASDVTLCSFERKPFEKLLTETPHISQRLVEMAMDELDAARDWMVLLGRLTAREKIVSLLMLMIRRSTIRDDDTARVQKVVGRDVVVAVVWIELTCVARATMFTRIERVELL